MRLQVIKKLFLVLINIIFLNHLSAQKPLIDSTVYRKWPTVGDPIICNNGSYAAYTIREGNVVNSNKKIMLRATNSSWTTEITNVVSSVHFSSDNKRAFSLKENDTLKIITLGTSIVEDLPNVSSFSFPLKESGKCLAYLSNLAGKELIVRNLVTGTQKSFGGVNQYLFDDNGNNMVIEREIKSDSTTKVILDWVTLIDNNIISIWEGNRARSFCFDDSGSQLAFIEEKKEYNLSSNTLWYYKHGMNSAISLANDGDLVTDTSLILDETQGFSKSGNRLFLKLKNIDPPKSEVENVKVDVWSYRDAKLQSQQLNELTPNSYTSVINLQTHKIIQLEQENDLIRSSLFSSSNDKEPESVLVINSKGNYNERNWNEKAQPFVYLVSINDGSRKLINNKGDWKNVFSYILSPTGKYVIYYDGDKEEYFSYDVSTGGIRNITSHIQARWSNNDERPLSSYSNIRFEGWMKDDAAVFMYDQNDIWQIDPTARKHPINITNSYGVKHNMVFRLALRKYSTKAIAENEKLVLSAFNQTSKQNGFYSKILREKGDPQKLTMGAYIYYVPDHYLGESPVDAQNAEIYLIRRESATESPNYFITKDFQSFNRLSNLSPERNYNWVRTELLTWKTLDGTISQGVLYKPENFDPQKKYPIIFHYYETKSDELNKYHVPIAIEGPFEIPWFVSNGYLVFTPDIHYKTGETGESAVNSVVSAANYFSKQNWIDIKRMGIQGHSFGGYETNYIVTHSNVFAAAVSGAGPTDFISGYGSLIGKGVSSQFFFEIHQFRVGTSLWVRPDLYIKNSPIFLANKVTTPLLMMHNKDDGSVPFGQGVEFFTALRRLGKKVWMLQYDGYRHVVFDKAADDYTIRVQQFFDHYLKGEPAPKWMLDGIPAKMKGIDDGLQLVKEKDKNGNWITPGPGLLTAEEQKKVDALKKRKAVVIKMN